MKTYLFTILILGLLYNLVMASGDLPKPKSKMTFEEYNSNVVAESIDIFESREQSYRTIYLTLQVIAVIFSALIPVLVNSISDEIKKKRLITILSICVILAIGSTNVFKFKEQSTIYGTASIKLRKNLIDYESDRGLYEKITADSVKLKTYRYLSEDIIYNARAGLIEALPNSNTPMPQ
jgi:hypothetical protein